MTLTENFTHTTIVSYSATPDPRGSVSSYELKTRSRKGVGSNTLLWFVFVVDRSHCIPRLNLMLINVRSASSFIPDTDRKRHTLYMLEKAVNVRIFFIRNTSQI